MNRSAQKKLSLSRTTIRVLSSAQLGRARSGLSEPTVGCGSNDCTADCSAPDTQDGCGGTTAYTCRAQTVQRKGP